MLHADAARRFDGDGRLVDPATRNILASQLTALKAWAHVVQARAA